MLVAGMLLAAGQTARVMPLPQIDHDLVKLDGQLVEVRGWLARCAGFGCTLLPDAAARTCRPRSIRERRVDCPYLAIGGDREFDRSAADLQYHYVAIVGRITAACRVDLCTDRAPEIEPISIAPWSPPVIGR